MFVVNVISAYGGQAHESVGTVAARDLIQIVARKESFGGATLCHTKGLD
jgi:hypothetical protein